MTPLLFICNNALLWESMAGYATTQLPSKARSRVIQLPAGRCALALLGCIAHRTAGLLPM